MTDDERRAFAAKYGLRLCDVPGGDPADEKAQRLAERIRAFADKYGLRPQDVPDSPLFHEVQG